MATDVPGASESRKLCVQCHQEFTGRLVACPHDGTVLIPAQAHQDPYLGTKLADRYLVLSILGRGGMGVVYKAKQDLIDRIVAIKMLKSDLVADEKSVKRFQVEARAASRLNHPNVVTIHDFGIAPGGQPYLVMDYIEGESLSDIISRDGRVHWRRALPIFIQVCSALEQAHRQNIIHRDIKPSNVVLIKSEEKDDFVKVVDFGIAKLVSVSGEESLHLTKTGEVFGSPLYMSPEQCLGNPLDARSDIYSLGVTMYEALVGFPPLAGKTMVETMSKHINETPRSLRLVRPEWGIPEPIEGVILKALEKDRDLRFETMRELKEALEYALRLSTEQDEPSAQRVSSARVRVQPQVVSRPSVASAPEPEKPADSGVKAPAPVPAAGAARPAEPLDVVEPVSPSSPGIAFAIAVVLILALAGAGWAVWRYMSGTQAIDSATGTVYFLKEGSPAGKLHIFTSEGNLIKLTFSRLDKNKLQSPQGLANGAIWNIRFHTDDGLNVLHDAEFDRGFDEPVQQADRLVRRHYQLLADSKYREAYDDLSREWRKAESLETFEAGNRHIAYSKRAAEAPAEAIKIVRQDKDSVELFANLKWFTGGKDEYYAFTVTVADGRPYIDRVERITRSRFETE